MPVVGAMGAAWTLAPQQAEACGGTFCDANPPGPTSQSSTVDQTGENIIFVRTDDGVEAHIQVQYDPDTNAEVFAWLVPVPEVPTFAVGSEQFFRNVLAATVPTFILNSAWDPCGGGSTSGTSDSSTSGEGSSGDGDGDGDGGGGGPDVVYRDTVGAFDVAVLSGGTVEGVLEWLGANGYAQDETARPIIESYLEQNYMFVAMKLVNAAEEPEIHPIRLGFSHQMPCIPLRLTKIAAVDDMRVRAFFFDDERTVPTNYRHVRVNPVELNWLSLGSNYEELVTLAVDSDEADGNAFVTEYAGASSIVSSEDLLGALWDSSPFLALGDSPSGVVELLEQQDLAYCDSFGCEFRHPLVEDILKTYVVPPDLISPEEYYDCIPCFEGLADLSAWDAVEFAAALEQRIMEPGRNATDILATRPYLTRLFTTISGYEMNEDPEFARNPDLGNVSNRQIANRQVHCDGSATMTLPDGRVVEMPNASSWPQIAPDEMPDAEDIEAGVLAGALPGIVDNTALIDALLADWNQTQNGGGGDDGADEGSLDAGAETGVESNGDFDGGGFNDEGGVRRPGACACDAEGAGGEGTGALALLSLGLLLRRRRD